MTCYEVWITDEKGRRSAGQFKDLGWAVKTALALAAADFQVDVVAEEVTL